MFQTFLNACGAEIKQFVTFANVNSSASCFFLKQPSRPCPHIHRYMWKQKHLLNPDKSFSTVTETVSAQTNKWTFTYIRYARANINRQQIVSMTEAGRLFPESSRIMLFLIKHHQQLSVSAFHHCIISVRLCKYRYYHILSQSLYQFPCNLHVCTNSNI